MPNPSALIALHDTGDSVRAVKDILSLHYTPEVLGPFTSSSEYLEALLARLKPGTTPHRIVMDLNLGSPKTFNLAPIESVAAAWGAAGVPPAYVHQNLIGISGVTSSDPDRDLILHARKRGIRALPKPFNVPDLVEDYVHFCTVQEAKELTLHDPHGFFDHLTPMDLTIRGVPDRGALQQRVQDSVQEWTREEKSALRPNLEARQKLLRERYPKLDFPGIVYLIKTDGSDEGGFAYVRGHSIIIPKSRIPEFKEDWKNGPYMPDHEGGHLLMNSNAVARRQTAEYLGFSGPHMVDLSHPNLRSKLLTNPDVIEHYVTLARVQGKPVSVLPVVYYDGAHEGETLREAMQSGGKLKLKLLEIDPSTEVLKPVFDQERPHLYDLAQVTDFQEQLRGHVPYAAPFDEALADLLPLIFSGQSSPVLDGIDAILREA